jgi:hypothetical protein
MKRPISPSGRPGMKRVQSSKGVEFQSSTATTKVSTMPLRNNPQKVRLCQLPGSGVGQMRKGGASSVRSRRRSKVTPVIRLVAKTKPVKDKSIMARGQKSRFALQICDSALTVLCR